LLYKGDLPLGYNLWLVWRQICSKKGKGLSIMTYISIFGIAVGVGALVIVLSIMGGFERDLREKMFSGLAHVEIYNSSEISGFSLFDLSPEKLRKQHSEIVQAQAFIKTDCVIKTAKGLIRPFTVFGIDASADGGSIWNFKEGMLEGSLEDLEIISSGENSGYPGIILGEDLAISLGVQKGSMIQVMNPHIESLGSGVKVSSFFVVQGTFLTLGSNTIDSSYGLMNFSQARKFMADYDYSLEQEKYVSGIALTLKDLNAVDEFKKKLTQDKDYSVRTWKDVNSSLLSALSLEKYTMSSILFLIVLVAAFSISGTLMMLVFHRRRNIAILRALGLKQNSIWKIFLMHGCFVGFAGSVVGLIFGGGFCYLLKYGQVLQVPLGVFVQSYLPVRFLYFEYGVICVCALALSMVASLYPSSLASKQSPSAGLNNI
jgi:lipoprotein-releasing system permease protein